MPARDISVSLFSSHSQQSITSLLIGEHIERKKYALLKAKKRLF